MRKLQMEELGRLSPEAFKKTEKAPIVLVLDNVRSALNVGSAFRTADAFALQHIYLCGITAQPPHREILKTALGATETMEWTHLANVTHLLRQLKREGYTILAIEQTDESMPLQDYKLEPGAKYALVFGNEVGGIDDEALHQADHAIEIPQFGAKHSINIAVCIGIVTWELFRQWRFG